MSRFVCCSLAARPSSAALIAKANATPHCHRERERCIVVRCVKYATYSRNHGCNAVFQPGNLINDSCIPVGVERLFAKTFITNVKTLEERPFISRNAETSRESTAFCRKSFRLRQAS